MTKAKNAGVSTTLGVFDSGIGGLTVVRALRKKCPVADILYLGDTARVPYGTKSARVVERYAVSCARFLVERGATQLVIACNTASATTLPRLEREFDIPVLGMIEPAARAACKATQTGKIGVIATESTIASESYQRTLRAIEPDLEVFAQPCPLFVPLAEEGYTDHAAARLIASDYLKDVVNSGIDTLVLGCTHYPILASLIASVIGPEITLIDSGEAAARTLSPQKGNNQWVFFATDVSSRVQRVGSAFLGETLPNVQHVDLP